jgi:hypothetical protein
MELKIEECYFIYKKKNPFYFHIIKIQIEMCKFHGLDQSIGMLGTY